MSSGISFKMYEQSAPASDYAIVQSSSALPSTFGPTDRKMYYVIDDSLFYLWDGTQWDAQEPDGVDELTNEQMTNLINIIA